MKMTPFHLARLTVIAALVMAQSAQAQTQPKSSPSQAANESG
jgi:hypothetical protein